MNILVASEPGVDGVFSYVENLCHFLIEREMGVHLAYSDRRGSDRLYKLVAQVEAHGGRTLNLRTANRPTLADMRALRSLHRLARAVSPDVIHSHSSKAGALARLLPFFGIKAVQVYHPHAYVGMRPNPGRLDVLYNFVESMLGRTAYTVVTSTGEKKFACERLRIPLRRIYYCPNAVDTDHFRPVSPEEKQRLRQAMGLPPNAPILGFIGRSSAQKNPLTLYRAFAKAAAITPICLFHVGKGELDSELEQLTQRLGIGHRVHRCPYMSDPRDFYRVVDGFILTSWYEGFSLAAIEALAANLPMVLSDAAGNHDLLELPLSHAWSAPPGDVDGFARAILAWRASLGATAAVNHRQIAQSRFDINKNHETILEIYKELMRASPLSHPTSAGINPLEV